MNEDLIAKAKAEVETAGERAKAEVAQAGTAAVGAVHGAGKLAGDIVAQVKGGNAGAIGFVVIAIGAAALVAYAMLSGHTHP